MAFFRENSSPIALCMQRSRFGMRRVSRDNYATKKRSEFYKTVEKVGALCFSSSFFPRSSPSGAASSSWQVSTGRMEKYFSPGFAYLTSRGRKNFLCKLRRFPFLRTPVPRVAVLAIWFGKACRTGREDATVLSRATAWMILSRGQR